MYCEYELQLDEQVVYSFLCFVFGTHSLSSKLKKTFGQAVLETPIGGDVSGWGLSQYAEHLTGYAQRHSGSAPLCYLHTERSI